MRYKFYQYPRGANKGGILKTEICPTISTSSWENNCFLIEIMEVIRTDTTICLNNKVDGKQPSLEHRIYDSSGISTAITTGFHPSVLEPRIIAMRGRKPECKNCNGNYKQRMEVNERGTSNTKTSVQKDNLVIEPKVLRINTATKQGYDEVKEGSCFDGAYPDSHTRRGRVQEEGRVTPALCTSNEVCYFESAEPRFRIRKLTPRECFRLMGVSEEDIDKIQAAGISNSQQYKMAGNSIVVDVLFHIFRMAFIENQKEKLTLF